MTSTPVRVFAASTPAEWLPARLLEFSIRETTSQPVEFAQLHTFERPIPMPAALQNRPRTPFSFQRFLIPELCGLRGQAIYMDADMQVFRDIAGLWYTPMEGCDLQTVQAAGDGRRGQFSVMLLDCERLAWSIDKIVAQLDGGALTYETLMYEMRVASKIGHGIAPHWNSLERFEPGLTSLLHYTDMNMQPWISPDNPLESLWIDGLRRALTAGFISDAELQREIDTRHVRPSLRARLQDDQLTRSAARQIDATFVAPYRSLKSGRARPWNSVRSMAGAALRKLRRMSQNGWRA
ncbi:glycosyltransferase [Cupriavidus sp. 2KB_3]|uniref:glycosyltransferase n=1 Tax=Cupriavidus sp. 2KB_3 TaxID=3232980 RepID=UPI003F8F4664